jgi:PKD repeat protein
MELVSGPEASFEVSPGIPSARSQVRLVDRSSESVTSWLWEFGDGHSSTLQNPTHVYEAAGWYPVTLRVSSASGTTQTTTMVEVVQAGTLRLLSQAGHAFDVTLEARDPRTGNTGVGEAIPQNDVFGYFTIPALVPTNPGAPLVPEVFVKMLDARPIGQDFWVFWGGLTDLEYTLTIRDTVTGATKVKHNPVTDSQVCLGADTGGFGSLATPTLSSAVATQALEGVPSFSMTPVNPGAAQTVQFTDTASGLSPMGWLWEFGDGKSSRLQNPTHVYEAAGWYPVTLRVSSVTGTTQTTTMVEVVQAGTLRLLSQAGHAFDVTLEARDPRTGNTGVGEAIPQNDVFGYFTIPALVPTNPGAPLVPEVFVKMLDARPIGQGFWVFWGGLTDLEYTLTIRDTVTGATKVKHNPVTDSQVCLGADTGGFPSLATPTPTRTPPAATPTRTPTPPSGPTVVTLEATQWQWSFNNGGNTFQMHVGQSYQVQITNGDPVGQEAHGFSGIPSLGMAGKSILASGDAPTIRNITPSASQIGTHFFECSRDQCSVVPSDHEGMVGSIQVVP